MTIETTENTEVTPFMKGVFSIYQTPDGGLLLSYRVDGADEDTHVPVPAPLVMMAQQAMDGGKMPSMFEVMKMARPGKRR